jgi:sugar phosphate isomerase/epimerase
MTDFSYQLYSSRNYGPLGDTLNMLAGLGYAQVEGYGGLYANLEKLDELKGQLAETGLKMTSGHVGIDMLEKESDRVLEIAKALNMQAIFCPAVGPDERVKSLNGWKEFGQRLAAAAKPYVDAGLEFGWHNHHFEFVTLEDGSVPMTHILEQGPDLSWEMDVAWVVKGNHDPLEWMAKYGDRITAAHVKDIAPEGECTDEDGWADVGHGTLDWKGLMAALRKTNAKLFVMEHDNPSDDKRFATRSIATAKTL